MVPPSELAVIETLHYLSEVLRGRTRVLEVGCGDGEVARRLAADGFSVTALDRQLRDVRPAKGVGFVESDFLAFKDEPYDAVVFTASLHHICPLANVIERVIHLLNPGGLLVADDFDLEAPGEETVRWYYETQELLAEAGLYPRDRIQGAAGDSPLEQWRSEHAESPPLHSGRHMINAIMERFQVVEPLRGPYLYRYICAGLPADERGARIAKYVLEREKHHLTTSRFQAVGLRIVAKTHDEGGDRLTHGETRGTVGSPNATNR